MATLPRHPQVLDIIGRRRNALLAAGAVVVGMSSFAVPASASSFPEAVQTAIEDRVQTLVDVGSTSDPMYFQRSGDVGVWRVGATGCTRCQLGPAVAAAQLTDGTYDSQVKATVTRYLGRVQADGSIPSADTTGTSTPINTMFSLRDLEAIVVGMGNRLEPAVRTKWVAAIAKSARYLVSSGESRWYANGNISLGYATVLGIAATLTLAPDLEQAYDATWSFAQDPGSNFPNQGFRITRTPTRADGRDGAGYYTETGSDASGFDAHYTQVQLDAVTQLWTVRQEPRVLRILNLLAGSIAPRVNSGWMLDTGSGSRHPLAGTSFPALSPGLAVASACDADAATVEGQQFDAANSWLDRTLDAKTPADNETWAEYFGSSVAQFAALPSDPGCAD